jgi:hypothetical protein
MSSVLLYYWVVTGTESLRFITHSLTHSLAGDTALLRQSLNFGLLLPSYEGKLRATHCEGFFWCRLQIKNSVRYASKFRRI